MNILIAYDGSDGAKAAIDGLQRAGLPERANALVVRVDETLAPMPVAPAEPAARTRRSRVAVALVRSRAGADHADREDSALAGAGCRRTHKLFPRWGVYDERVVGVPVKVVIQKAIDWQADLIVVGSQGRSALGRLVLGSVSKGVATEARCSVRVARHVVERSGPVRIIVGVDGSAGAEATIGAVASRSWPRGTAARLIAVDDTIRPTGTAGLVPMAAAWVAERNEEHLTKAHAMVAEAADVLLDAGLAVTLRMPKGSPRDVLSQEAASWEADCIFVGARGVHGSDEPSRTGSVSKALVTHAPCSVEIIRNDASVIFEPTNGPHAVQ